ncbi:PTS transporter subunit EIIC [Mollicutes bacterium LVI A0039]|nr:PTS transporter subunit EIIC [Mollicutes bacterium LVI A0039]
MNKKAMEMKVLEFSGKIADNMYLQSIKYAFTALTPLIIVGAFSLLIKALVTDDVNGLAAVNGFEFLAQYKPIFNNIQYATYNILTILIVFLISMELADRKGFKEAGYIPAVFSLAAYISIIPKVTMFTPEGMEEAFEVGNVIARSYTDTSALFLGMFVALAATSLFCWLSSLKRLKITMPDSVPQNVGAAFSALFPIAIGLFIFSAGEFAFEAIFNMSSYDAIFKAVQVPLAAIVQGLPGILLLMLTAQVFWLFGIHGNQIIKPIREPLLLDAINQNMEAFNNGLDIPNIVTMPFWDIYGNVGGSGMTLGLVIAVLLFSKRDDFREVTKLSAVPGVFNINETMIFGIPVVLNPVLAVPFVLTPLVGLTIGYIMTYIGFAGKTVIMIPWTTPPILSAYLATAGSIGAVITQIICIAVAVLIYAPFVKMANKEINEK